MSIDFLRYVASYSDWSLVEGDYLLGHTAVKLVMNAFIK